MRINKSGGQVRQAQSRCMIDVQSISQNPWTHHKVTLIVLGGPMIDRELEKTVNWDGVENSPKLMWNETGLKVLC